MKRCALIRVVAVRQMSFTLFGLLKIPLVQDARQRSDPKGEKRTIFERTIFDGWGIVFHDAAP